MGKGKAAKKNKLQPIIQTELLEKKVGDEATDGHIAKIYFATSSYIIYESLESPTTLSYQYTDDQIRKNLIQIMPMLGKLRTYLDSATERVSYFPQIASVYALCFDNDVAGANSMIENIILDIKKHRADRNNAQLTYLGICFLIVVLNIIAALFLKYNTNITNDPGFWIYSKMALWGSFGGFLSITYKLNKYEYDFNASGLIRLLSAVSRIFIAMLSGLFMLALIKSNIALGFLSTLSSSNPFVLYCFAVLAGFSESFVPDLLKVLETKSTEVKAPVEK